MKNCDSCSGSGWMSDEAAFAGELPKYRRCDDCGGKGEYQVKRTKKRRGSK